uniref:Laminin, alpha 4 n=1 Tax=Electrophorus electricus TaxID=8005 RepID=A0A4W4FRY8_ELEEL
MSEQHTCLPCNCKNHSHTCEDITGLCIDCQDHSTGDFCERCEDGYLLHQTPGSHECRPCSCPISLESNKYNLPHTLTLHSYPTLLPHIYLCLPLLPGRCAPGYYGNPMRVGDSCKKCECNGNSDPNLIFSECHNVTGQCLHCWGNTHGDHCERCTSGYYGDAIIAKDCQGEFPTHQLKYTSTQKHINSNTPQLQTSLHKTTETQKQLKNTSTPNTSTQIHRITKTYQLKNTSTPNISAQMHSNSKTHQLKNTSTPNISTQIHCNSKHLISNSEFLQLALLHLCSNCCVCVVCTVCVLSALCVCCLLCVCDLHSNLKGSDTDRLVQKALQASSVYDNIIKYIDDANITSLTTLNLSVRADDVSLIHTDYNTGISRTPARLQFTQAVVEGTLNRSAEVLGAMTPIREQVEEWSRNMRNDQYSTSAYNQAVTSARNTVSSLSEVVPELLSKLRVVEEKKTATNISINILRVRELIAQARSVARKVQVSMKFNGQSAVELHPHPSMEELKAVTSISLYVRVDPDKDPIEDRFLLYLGDKNGRKDYMGLAIKNDNLVYVYNLGGEDVEIPLSSKPVSSWPPVFNLIRVERLGRHGKVFLTVPSQDSVAEQKFIQKGEADGTDSIFHLDRKDTVFIIGGVPPDVKLPPALSLAPFVGCVELATLNNEVISLYNFRKLHKMDVTTSVPCPRYKLAFSQGRVASYLFDGTGYALVSNIERRGRIGVVTRFDIEVRTVANNGILFLMVNQSDFFVLELRNGFLRLVYDFGYSGGPVVLESNLTKLQINDARYHEVSVIYHFSKKMILLVDRSYVKAVESEKKTLPFSDIYIGGAPSSLLLSRYTHLSSLVGLKGCVKGFQFQKKDFNLLEEPGTIGISSGCPEDSYNVVYFNQNGYLGSSGKISPFSSFEGGLNFNTQQPSGLLYYHRQGSDEFTLSLENGAVVLHSRGTKVRSNKKNYNDGRSHFLLASVTKQIYQLVIDDKDKQEKTNPDASSPPDSPVKMFYYGGSPHSKISNFTGCISHAYLSRQDRDIEAEDFQRYTEHVQVSLQDCPEERPPASLLPASVRRSSAPSRKVSDVPSHYSYKTETKPCHLSPHPRSTRHAHHYGGSAQSRREYDGIAEVIRERCHFSLSVRTRSASGLLFYVSDGSEEDFMALFLSDGKLLFSFGSSQQRLLLSSRDKHNDGHWHNVICSREGALGRLIVDGVAVVEQGLPNSTTSLHLQDPLYVAGVPPGHAQKNLQMSSEFSGCLRGFQLNGGWMTSASRSFGVTPCYEGSMEPGTYFSEEGGYVVLDDSFNLGLKFELVMEVRPRVSSGVLLHVFTAAQEYLTLHLRYSQVRVYTVPGQSLHCTRSEFILQQSVIRDMKMVHLGVDSEMKHVVTAEPLHTERPRAPVFIGGAPDSLLPVSMRSVRNYTGCVRNLLVNKSPVSFSRAALVSGAVSVGTCPVA